MIFGLMVTRNEAGRYLECALTHLRRHVDYVIVFDDQSDDATVDVAARLADVVGVRPAGVEPLLVHEGRFRRAAWQFLEEAARPLAGDWILAVDADELVVAADRSGVARVVAAAEAAGAAGATVAIPEAWSLAPVAVRADRMWAGQRTLRLAAWRPAARFPFEYAEEAAGARGPLPSVERRRDALAGGSMPAYAAVTPWPASADDLQLLHLGYADPADRVVRHGRYKGRRGHNPTHVSSILAAPRVEPWQGPDLTIWRGHQ